MLCAIFIDVPIRPAGRDIERYPSDEGPRLRVRVWHLVYVVRAANTAVHSKYDGGELCVGKE